LVQVEYIRLRVRMTIIPIGGAITSLYERGDPVCRGVTKVDFLPEEEVTVIDAAISAEIHRPWTQARVFWFEALI